MKDLETEQREMRERMNPQTTNVQTKTKPKSAVRAKGRRHNSPGAVADDDVKTLKQRIHVLETENRALKAEIGTLRLQKTVYVERESSGEDRKRQNAHNYFKYGGGRRW